MIDGEWHDVWDKAVEGRFVRKPTTFRGAVTADGSSGFPAEAGRYHLYVSLACPWAHRTLVFRALKKLEDVISVSVVDPLMLEQGWSFSAERPDHLFGLAADGFDGITPPRRSIDCDNRRLIDHNASVLHMHQCVGGT